MICSNVLPRQVSRIPWGWKNRTIESSLSGKETYVIEPKGDLKMPNLCSYFDWKTWIVEGLPVWFPFGTRNMKSIFTTATRLLGFERLLIELPSLEGITEEFLKWNDQLLNYWSGTMEVFFLGDDFAGNQGLFMSPDLWRAWLKPEYWKLLSLAGGLVKIFHSDGDIFDILDDLIELKVDAVSYEPVGRMKNIGEFYKRLRMIPVEDQKQTHENSMALQR